MKKWRGDDARWICAQRTKSCLKMWFNDSFYGVHCVVYDIQYIHLICEDRTSGKQRFEDENWMVVVIWPSDDSRQDVIIDRNWRWKVPQKANEEYYYKNNTPTPRGTTPIREYCTFLWLSKECSFFSFNNCWRQLCDPKTLLPLVPCGMFYCVKMCCRHLEHLLGVFFGSCGKCVFHQQWSKLSLLAPHGAPEGGRVNFTPRQSTESWEERPQEAILGALCTIFSKGGYFAQFLTKSVFGHPEGCHFPHFSHILHNLPFLWQILHIQIYTPPRYHEQKSTCLNFVANRKKNDCRFFFSDTFWPKYR